MAKIVVLSLPGTGSPNGGDGITEDFHKHLDSSRYDCRIVPYAAAFGLTADITFADSRATGRTALLATMEKLPPGTEVILGGYSQGAVIVGDFAREVETGGVDLHVKIVAVAMIADGYRPHGYGVVPPGQVISPGYGVCGERYLSGVPFPAFWVSAWGDPICALPAGNPLRTVADLIDYFNIRTPQAAVKWGASVLDAVTQGRLQDWWRPDKWAKWNSAIAFARGFLFDGRHTRDYIRYGYTKALADAIMEHTRRS